MIAKLNQQEFVRGYNKNLPFPAISEFLEALSDNLLVAPETTYTASS